MFQIENLYRYFYKKCKTNELEKKSKYIIDMIYNYTSDVNEITNLDKYDLWGNIIYERFIYNNFINISLVHSYDELIMNMIYFYEFVSKINDDAISVLFHMISNSDEIGIKPKIKNILSLNIYPGSNKLTKYLKEKLKTTEKTHFFYKIFTKSICIYYAKNEMYFELFYQK